MCKNVKKSYLVQKEELIYKEKKKQAKFRRRKEDLPTQGTLNYTIIIIAAYKLFVYLYVLQ